MLMLVVVLGTSHCIVLILAVCVCIYVCLCLSMSAHISVCTSTSTPTTPHPPRRPICPSQAQTSTSPRHAQHPLASGTGDPRLPNMTKPSTMGHAVCSASLTGFGYGGFLVRGWGARLDGGFVLGYLSCFVVIRGVFLIQYVHPSPIPLPQRPKHPSSTTPHLTQHQTKPNQTALPCPTKPSQAPSPQAPKAQVSTFPRCTRCSPVAPAFQHAHPRRSQTCRPGAVLGVFVWCVFVCMFVLFGWLVTPQRRGGGGIMRNKY